MTSAPALRLTRGAEAREAGEVARDAPTGMLAFPPASWPPRRLPGGRSRFDLDRAPRDAHNEGMTRRCIAAFALAAALAVGAPSTPRPPTSTPIVEDDPRWDCRTMGNRQCGPQVPMLDLDGLMFGRTD